jgi:hypothetical protein
MSSRQSAMARKNCRHLNHRSGQQENLPRFG